MENPWITHSKKEVYSNPWIAVSHEEVTTPGGSPGIYGVVQFKNVAIGILPLDKDMNTWIVGQYRYTLDKYSWEIPEGGGPHGIDLLDSAKRELKEETGLIAKKWTPIVDLQISNSVTNEMGIAYVAQELTQGEAEPEDTEDLKVRKLHFNELLDMAMKGEIEDALSLVTIFKTKLLLDMGELVNG